MDGGLRQLFRRHLPGCHWQSIESWSTGQGVPDANYCFPPGIEGWVEFKSAKANKVVISPGQVAWAEQRHRAGGRVTLAVRLRARKGARDALYLYEGASFRGVYLKGLVTPPLARWEGGPGAWVWHHIRAVLTR